MTKVPFRRGDHSKTHKPDGEELTFMKTSPPKEESILVLSEPRRPIPVTKIADSLLSDSNRPAPSHTLAETGTRLDELHLLAQRISGDLASPIERDILRIARALISGGVTTEEQINEVLARRTMTNERFVQALVGSGTVDERVLTEILSRVFELGICDLRTRAPERDALALLPEALACENLSIPLSVLGDALCLTVAEPGEELEDILSKASGHSVQLLLSPLSDILQMIDEAYGTLEGVSGLVEAFESTELGRPHVGERDTSEDISGDAPAIQVVNRILTQAVRSRSFGCPC